MYVASRVQDIFSCQLHFCLHSAFVHIPPTFEFWCFPSCMPSLLLYALDNTLFPSYEGCVRMGADHSAKGEVSDAAPFKAYPPRPHSTCHLCSCIVQLQPCCLRVKGESSIQYMYVQTSFPTTFELWLPCRTKHAFYGTLITSRLWGSSAITLALSLW